VIRRSARLLQNPGFELGDYVININMGMLFVSFDYSWR
jgi:hypothetical protein